MPPKRKQRPGEVRRTVEALRAKKGRNSRLPRDFQKLSSATLSRSLWAVSSTDKAAAL